MDPHPPVGPLFPSNSETEMKAAFPESGFGRAAVYFYSTQDGEKRYLSTASFHPSASVSQGPSRGTPHANTSLLAVCVGRTTSCYRNARGTAIKGWEDQIVQYLRGKAQRGGFELSQAGKAESQKVNIRQLDLCGRQEVGGHSPKNGEAHGGDLP